MCGIAGAVGRQGTNPERSAAVRRMTATLVHRGPDGEGYASRDGCDLGFRRLAIIDPRSGASAFSNEDEGVWAVCNGEIYNADELRHGLRERGHVLRTGVDTEIIPHLYEEFGPDFVGRLDGMFALALWDERERVLVLGRDRAGEKPLFYWNDGGDLVFASELRAMLAHPRVPRAVDPRALGSYLSHGCFPAPQTPIQGVRKLPAGHVLVARRGSVTLRRYWDLADHFRPAGSDDRTLSDAAAELDQRIATAVRRRKQSDVPVGVFLSGGIDSATILAHLTEQNGRGVPVFALGHADRSFDEAPYAKRTARAFGAEYHELILDRNALAEGLRAIGERFDEPLGDASTIPTHLLALEARTKVKVVLTGEGGDELFAGYPTYIGHRVAEIYGRIPRPVRSVLARASRRLAPVRMGNVGPDYLLARFLADVGREPIDRHHAWFGSLPAGRHASVLAPRVGEVAGEEPAYALARSKLEGRSFPDALAPILYTDFVMYLQDGLLTKVDRATMLASLEARAPFLDHELAEFAAGLPSRLKLRGLTTKAVLRRAVRGRLPREVLSRRKRGFNIPFSRWLLEGLGEELRERFSRERVEGRGLLAHGAVSELLDEHLSCRVDHRKPLFTLLALDLWCDRVYGEGAVVPLGELALTGAA